MTITTRQATPEDYEAIASLYRQQLSKQAAAFPGRYKETGAQMGITPNYFEATLGDANWAFCVAEREGKLVGAAQFSESEEAETDYRNAFKTAWIEDLVLAESDDQEAGRTLVQAAIAWAKERGLSDVEYIWPSYYPWMASVAEELSAEPVSSRSRFSSK